MDGQTDRWTNRQTHTVIIVQICGSSNLKRYKSYQESNNFNFEIVNFPFLDGDVPRSPSYGVDISQLIRFARVCPNVDDVNNRNLFLTAKLLEQG